ncbi:MAG: hypothetical protein COA99_11835 [Moraxellaceae bacterium]|nr:MAG: hypothetical protein COA99_11835 [Moraxellaceae bacterium]
MNVITRTLMMAPIALLITLCLLLLMATLIQSSDQGLSETRLILPTILMPDVQIETRRLIEKPEKPKLIEAPDTPVLQQHSTQQTVTQTLRIAPPNLMSNNVNLSIGVGLQASDGEYLPIVKVAPNYPALAARRGIEGFVILEYTVTHQGTTKDIVVIEAKPSSIFNRNAIRSARRYKYKPRMKDGVAVDVHGVRTIINFEMEK